jgi:hypothetical protein
MAKGMIMENNMLLDSLKNNFFISFSMMEKVMEICPDELWNCKKSGFIFWQQLLHTLAGIQYWLREENTQFDEPFKEKNVYPELDGNPENILSKEDIKKYCNEVKQLVNKWFEGKDDNWLKMYHIGHCEAIFRENGIKTGEYLDCYSYRREVRHTSPNRRGLLFIHQEQ